MVVDELLKVGSVKAELAADLHDRQLVLGHEPTHVADRGAEELGGLGDVQQLGKWQLLDSLHYVLSFLRLG